MYFKTLKKNKSKNSGAYWYFYLFLSPRLWTDEFLPGVKFFNGVIGVSYLYLTLSRRLQKKENERKFIRMAVTIWSYPVTWILSMKSVPKKMSEKYFPCEMKTYSYLEPVILSLWIQISNIFFLSFSDQEYFH